MTSTKRFGIGLILVVLAACDSAAQKPKSDAVPTKPYYVPGIPVKPGDAVEPFVPTYRKRPGDRPFYVTGGMTAHGLRDDRTVPPLVCYGLGRTDALMNCGITVWSEAEWHECAELGVCKDPSDRHKNEF